MFSKFLSENFRPNKRESYPLDQCGRRGGCLCIIALTWMIILSNMSVFAVNSPFNIESRVSEQSVEILNGEMKSLRLALFFLMDAGKLHKYYSSAQFSKEVFNEMVKTPSIIVADGLTVNIWEVSAQPAQVRISKFYTADYGVHILCDVDILASDGLKSGERIVTISFPGVDYVGALLGHVNPVTPTLKLRVTNYVTQQEMEPSKFRSI